MGGSWETPEKNEHGSRKTDPSWVFSNPLRGARRLLQFTLFLGVAHPLTVSCIAFGMVCKVQIWNFRIICGTYATVMCAERLPSVLDGRAILLACFAL